MDKLTVYLKEQWNNMNKLFVYHSTTIENANSILQDGLKTGMKSNYTQAGKWADEFYKIRPIYVSINPGKYNGQVILKIDITGYYLFADLPTLIDHGAILQDNNIIDMSKVNIPNQYQYIPDELEIGYDILNIQHGYDKEIISITKTAAIVNNIPPNKISLYNQP